MGRGNRNPGCDCCGGCNNCDGTPPAEYEAVISGVALAAGSGCADGSGEFNGTHTLTAVSGNGVCFWSATSGGVISRHGEPGKFLPQPCGASSGPTSFVLSIGEGGDRGLTGPVGACSSHLHGVCPPGDDPSLLAASLEHQTRLTISWTGSFCFDEPSQLCPGGGGFFAYEAWGYRREVIYQHTHPGPEIPTPYPCTVPDLPVTMSKAYDRQFYYAHKGLLVLPTLCGDPSHGPWCGYAAGQDYDFPASITLQLP